MLDIIEMDNLKDSNACCIAMWKEWLKIDPCASIEKVKNAIELLPAAIDKAKRGNYCNVLQ